MSQLLSRAFGGGRGGAVKRYLGHTQNAVSVLGSTVNSMNRLGYTNTPFHKAHHYSSKYLSPFLQTAQKVLE